MKQSLYFFVVFLMGVSSSFASNSFMQKIWEMGFKTSTYSCVDRQKKNCFLLYRWDTPNHSSRDRYRFLVTKPACTDLYKRAMETKTPSYWNIVYSENPRYHDQDGMYFSRENDISLFFQEKQNPILTDLTRGMTIACRSHIEVLYGAPPP